MSKDLKAELQFRYDRIVYLLGLLGGRVCQEELCTRTGYNKNQISKALQHGRRSYDFEAGTLKGYVMGSPDGYFLPKDETEVIAYVAQTFKDVRSRWRTLQRLYEFSEKTWPFELTEAINDSGDDESDEAEPWAVFNKLTGGF